MISAIGSNGVGSAESDSNGMFTISQGLGAGIYSVSIFPPHGYVNASLTANINQSTVTDLGDIYLNASGIIKGIVQDPNGSPLANVPIILNDNKNNTVDFVSSSADGSFFFDRNIVNGTYSVQAFIFPISGAFLQMVMQFIQVIPGIQLPPFMQNLTQMFISIPYASNSLTGVQGVQGQTISGLVLQLLPTGTISGAITDTIGNGIANVTIMVQPKNASFGLGYSYGGIATTDSTGRYSLGSNLPTGTYNVSIFSGFGVATGFVANMTDIRTVNVTAGSTTTVNFQLKNSGVISGTVSQNGNPVSGIAVSAISSAASIGFATTGSDGNYSINTGLDTGQYTVMANNEYLHMQTVNVTAGEVTSGVDFNLTSVVAFVSGKVVNSTGGAHIFATVKGVNDTFFAYATAVTDNKGKYELQFTLPNGQTSLQVNVTASLMGYAPSSRVVTINAWQTTSPVDFILNPLVGGTLKGRIVTNVVPLQSATLMISTSGSSVVAGSPLTLSGTISPARSGAVTIYQSINGSGFAVLNTTNLTSGAYSHTFSPSAPGTYQFYASWLGDAQYTPADSPTINVSVTAVPLQTPTLTIQSSAANVNVGSIVILAGSLSPTGPGSVTIWRSVNGSSFQSIANVTLTNGAYSHSYNISAEGTYQFKASYPGSSQLNPVQSTVISVSTAQVGADYTWYIIGGVIVVIAVIALAYYMFLRPKAKPIK